MIGTMQNPVILEREVLDVALDILRRLAKDDPGAREAYLRLVPAIAGSDAELELLPELQATLTATDHRTSGRKMSPLRLERAAGGGRPE